MVVGAGTISSDAQDKGSSQLPDVSSVPHIERVYSTGKRRRDLSIPEEGTERRPKRTKTISAPKRTEVPPAPQIRRCAVCSFPCWLCRTEGKPASERSYREDNPDKDSDSQQEGLETMDTVRAPSSSSSKRKRTDGLTYVGPKDDNFKEFILIPCGISVKEDLRPSKPEDIPDDGIAEDPSQASKVHLQIDMETAGQIARQIRLYHRRRYNEATFTKLITNWLAPFDDYVSIDGPQLVTSLWRERWKPGKAGPYVSSQMGYIYDWDIEPDTTYMIALNLFEASLRDEISAPDLQWLLAEPSGVSPYLTFEMKTVERSGKESDAIHQITAAAALWLHQRRRLKEELQASDFSDVRHYSLVVISMTYQVWEATYDGKKYIVQMIHSGSFNEAEGVVRYAKWSNAIHKWGLGTNARAFRKDVIALLKKRRNPQDEDEDEDEDEDSAASSP